MKKIVILLLSFIMALATVNGRVEPPPSWTTDCTDNGFDYAIAKYQCGSYTPDEELISGTSIVLWGMTNGDCLYVQWASDILVGGVVTKEANNYYVHPGGTSGTINFAGEHGISHITFCGNYGEIPEFTTIGAALVLAGAGLFIYRKRN